MKKNVSKGSAFLIIILITSTLSLFMLSCWYKSSLLFDLVLQQERYYKNFYLTEGLLNFGIQIIEKDYDFYLNSKVVSKMPIVLDLNFLIKDLAKDDYSYLQNCNARFIVNKMQEQGGLILSAVLQDKNAKNNLCKLSCLIEKDGLQENKKPKFVIQNFTCDP